jgi:hypothetical protein
VTEKYEFIDAEKDAMTETGEKKYTVVKMCEYWVCRRRDFTSGAAGRNRRPRGGAPSWPW